MAAQLGNYVLETATSPGTGGFTLNGAEANRRAFSTAFPSGGSVLYFADDGSQAEWGIGTLTVGKPSTLARSTVLGNTAGTKIALNFPGSVEVYNEIPAEMAPVLEQDGSLTLAGSLTVKGKTLVQNVDDWTAYQAVGAKDADARYIRSPANPGTDYRIQTLSRNKFSGGIFAFAEDGSNTQLQPAGDYATNPALQSETQRATTIESNLQSSKANLNGGNSYTGNQSVYNAPVVVHNAPTLTPRSWNYSPALIARTDSRAGLQLFAQDQVDGGAAAVVLTYEWSTVPRVYWWFGSDGSINNSVKGEVAFQSDLPFVDKNLRWFVVRELVTKDGSGHSTHKFPVAFAARTQPFVLPVGSREDNTTYASLPMISLDSNGNPLISNTGMTLYWSTGSGNSITRAWLTYLVGGYF